MGGVLRRGVWSVAGSVVVLALSATVLVWLNRATPPTEIPYSPLSQIMLATSAVLVGALIVSRHPGNSVGWIFIGSALCIILSNAAIEYGVRAAIDAGLPAGQPVRWVGDWLYFPGYVGLTILLPIVFPAGTLPSRRWRLGLAILVPVVLAFVAADAISIGRYGVDLAGRGFPDALSRIREPGVLLPVVRFTGVLATVVGVVIAVAAILTLVSRFRHASGDARLQLKWLLYAVAVTATSAMLALSAPLGRGSSWFFNLFALSSVAIPVAAGLAILKYRLYDIDLVINRTLVFGALAAFITAVYVAIVAGVGTVIGSAGRLNLPLSIAATAVVALAFGPVRELVQRIANRLVYGKRATPYEVLAQFSNRVAGGYSSEELLPRMVQVVAQGTGAVRATAWIDVAGALVAAATWPEGEPAIEVTSASLSVPVRYQGENLGRLCISKGRGDPVTPVERSLLEDLASQAGLVVRNARLSSELQARVQEVSNRAQELRASRQRIVAAQDGERRRLERNIHDGAQQHLVALVVKLKLAASLARRKPEEARAALRDLEAAVSDAVATLEDLVSGIYPAALRADGLLPALSARARTMTIPVRVLAPGLPRYPLEVEAAAYFACLEALQNVAKHARAASVSIRLQDRDGDLAFSVEDDGIGLPSALKLGSGLQNMKDRLSALGGTLSITSHPGQGTVVSGSLPAGCRQAYEPTRNHRCIQPL